MNGSTSKSCLYWINTLMITLSVLVLGFAIYAVADPSQISDVIGTQLPKWMFFFSGAFALLIILISLLGICSAKTESKCGFAVYILVVLLALIVQIACAGYLAQEFGVMNSAVAADVIDKANLPSGIAALEKDIVDMATKSSNAEQWVKTQDALKCCGYDLRWAAEQSEISSSDMLDTGKVCTEYTTLLTEAKTAVSGTPSMLKQWTDTLNNVVDGHNEFFCKGKIIQAGKKYALYITITAGILAFFQLVAVCAASHLACCISKNEGGYMEDWRPATRGENYQASQITGTTAGQPVVQGGAQYNYA